MRARDFLQSGPRQIIQILSNVQICFTISKWYALEVILHCSGVRVRVRRSINPALVGSQLYLLV